jgi:hypothetical protein
MEDSRTHPVPVRIDRRTVLLVRRAMYERLGGDEGVKKWFSENRKPSAGDIASMREIL